MEKTHKVAIIGAGLTGLTAAYYLSQKGIEVVVYERDAQPGGVIRTHREKGFVYESGPNTGVLGQPEALELLEALAPDCKVEIADEAAKARWIWKGNRWHALPSGLWSGITTPLFSFKDKLRLLGEPFRRKGNNPAETLAQMVERRMGKSFLQYAVDPFILGIYAGDPNYLVTKYAMPKLYQLEQRYGSFIGGALKKAREPKTERDRKATREVFSVEGGLDHIVKALTVRVGMENIRTDCGDITVVPGESGGYQIATGKGTDTGYSHVITTVGARSLQQLIPFAWNENLDKICCLRYARVVQLSIGFNKWEGIPLKSFGGLVPFEEHRDVLGALFISSFLKNRAPEGGALLAVFMGGLRRPEMAGLTDEEIIALASRELMEMMQLPRFEPDLLVIHRYEEAIPQYGPESADKMETIGQIEQNHPGLLLAGNIRDGIGMADRIRQGRLVADQVAGQIAEGLK